MFISHDKSRAFLFQSCYRAVNLMFYLCYKKNTPKVLIKLLGCSSKTVSFSGLFFCFSLVLLLDGALIQNSDGSVLRFYSFWMFGSG